MKTSCGIFLYDINSHKLLVGKCCKANKMYSIPKGSYDSRVDLDYKAGAERETAEETGINIKDINVEHYEELTESIYPSKKKRLIPFLVIFKSSTPLKPFCNILEGKELPEFESFEWMALSKAKEALPSAQAACITEIADIIYKKYNLK